MTGHLQGALNERVDELIRAGRALHRRGWLPAGSGSLSARLDRRLFAVSVQGADTGAMHEDDLLVVNEQGHAVHPEGTPSPEAPLHTAVYRALPWVGAVVHIHSINATLASLSHQDAVRLQGYELLAKLRGIRSPREEVSLPILANDPNQADLARQAVEAIRRTAGVVPGWLIQGNGLCTWGTTIRDVQRNLEVLDFLLECNLRSKT